MINGLTEGRIVRYVLANGAHRPGIVVRDWKQDNGLVNLVVFLDGSNDSGATANPNPNSPLMIWATSAHFSAEGKELHTWHWPEKHEKS